MPCARPQLRRHRALLVVSIGFPLAEAILLLLIGPPASVALAPQITAVAPFGTFHDLRWLFVFHRSWGTFAIEAAAFIAFRSVLTAVLVRSAWPCDVPRPAFDVVARRTLAFTIVTAIVLSPFVALLVAMSVVSVSWLFFVAVPATVIVAALVHHGAVESRWWRRHPPLRTVGWIAASFAVLTMTSAAATLVSPPLAPVAVALGGLFNAWAWLGTVHAICCRASPSQFVPIAPLGVLSLVGVIALGVTLGFAVVTRPGDLHRGQSSAHPPGGRPVLVVSGFGSTWDGGDPGVHFRGDLDVERFSYRGVDGDGRPVPYDHEDTYASVPHLVRLMADQVEHLHRRAGRPVTIVAESEGALVAKSYVLSRPHVPVEGLILLSPLVAPGRVYYPQTGTDGWGKAAGAELRVITAALRRLSPLTVSTDTPLLRSIVDNAPALRGALRCPADGVRQSAFIPLADAVVAPEPDVGGLDVDVVPAFHGGLLTNPSTRRTIGIVLGDGALPKLQFWRASARAIRAAAVAWQVPELPLHLNRQWDAPDGSPPSCAEIRRWMQRWTTTTGAGGD
jgi:hypothetical protein